MTPDRVRADGASPSRLDLSAGHQHDLSATAALEQRVRSTCVAQRHALAHRENELPVANVVGELANLRRVRTREHAVRRDARRSRGIPDGRDCHDLLAELLTRQK
jgi:hypothetical protein